MRFYHQAERWQRALIQYSLIFVFGGLFQVVFIEYFLLGYDNFSIKNLVLRGSYWLVMWKGSEFMVTLMDKTGIHWYEQPLIRFLLTFVITVIYIVTAVIILDVVFFVIFGKIGFWQLINSLKWGNFSYAIYITLGIGTFMHGRAFLMEWRQAAIKMEQFKNDSLKSQYESLKNQVNPHFLFNSLNALSSLVYDDQDKAVKFIKKLSQVYRYVLDKKDQELVPIDDEIAFLDNYIFLQQIRFGENLKVEINRGNFDGIIPPLGIQLLVENAIKHNVVSEKNPLTVEVTITANYYSIRNNIQEKLTKDSTGIGLNNLQARYEFLTKKSIEIIKENNVFEVRLPALKNKSKLA
ncbi:MAG: sensor histidine kinase YesM [Cyclobacteriaceae bacterium]|jgi:sensor histidine kinase YesM